MRALFVVCAVIVNGSAAAASLSAAEDAFAEGRFSECLSALDELERETGPTPRTASLRVLANHEKGYMLDAYKALRVYMILVDRSRLSGDEGHQRLVALEEQLKTRLEQEREEKYSRIEQEAEEAEVPDVDAQQQVLSTARAKAHDAFVRATRLRRLIEDAVEARRARDQSRR